MDKNTIIESINAEEFVKDLMHFIFDYGFDMFKNRHLFSADIDRGSNEYQRIIEMEKIR